MSAGSQEAGLQPPGQQPHPAPISLELFGMRETEDEPMTLPEQAIAVAALPTPALSDTDNGMLSLTGTLAYVCSQIMQRTVPPKNACHENRHN